MALHQSTHKMALEFSFSVVVILVNWFLLICARSLFDEQPLIEFVLCVLNFFNQAKLFLFLGRRRRLMNRRSLQHTSETLSRRLANIGHCRETLSSFELSVSDIVKCFVCRG